MKAIDEERLESDLAFRFEYLSEFIGFGSADAAAIMAVAPRLGPVIPAIVEKTYDKMLSYDATARHFLPRQSGFEGDMPATLADLSVAHGQIQLRKEHLSRYFTHILSRTCDAKMVPFFEMVGKIHTSRAGNPEIEVPAVQMNALMGYLSDLLMELISELPIDSAQGFRSIRALNKLLWIQNDFINRQYQQK